MSGRVFLDTNILVYADDADAGDKRPKAQELIATALERGTGTLSTQVLQEYFSVATRKLHIPADMAQRRIELFQSMTVVMIDTEHILDAIKLHRLYELSFWDALVVQAARRAGCATLLSEDMQTGRRIEGVTIENPFARVGVT